MKKLITILCIGVLSLSTLTGCNMSVNGETVFEASDEEIDALKQTGKEALDKVKDIATDEDVQKAVKDAAGSIKDAATN